LPHALGLFSSLGCCRPDGTFNNPNRPGGVQVALRWFGNPSRTTVGTTCGLPMTPRATSRRRSSPRPWPKSSTCPWSIHRSGCCQTWRSGYRAHHFRHTIVSDLRARPAGGIELLRQRNRRRRRRDVPPVRSELGVLKR